MTPRSRAAVFFFVSGFTALCYEVVWLRLLGLVFGNTTFAVSTVLSAYMAGLGFGGYFLGRQAERRRNPLRMYGFLEIGVGLYAALTPILMMLVQSVYASLAGTASTPFLLFVRLLLSFSVVFIPTFFMGGTLPVLIRFFLERDKSAGSITAFLYGLNTIGAVAGTLCAGFYLLPAFGINGTLMLCVVLNVLIGIMAIRLSRQEEVSEDMPVRSDARAVKQGIWLPAALFISGASAMLFEVAWTRILATVLGSSTYAFTLMLATFLLGLAIGSAFCRKWLSQHQPTVLAWGYLQIAISVSALAVLPLYPWVSLGVVRLYGLSIGHPNLMLFLTGLVSFGLMFMPAFSFGALFPMSVALYVRNPADISRKVGFLYLWNTAGNIVGSLSAGFLLIPMIGIQKTVLVAIVMGSFLAAVAAGAGLRRIIPSVIAIVAVMFVAIGSVWLGVNGWDVRLVTSGLNVHAPAFVGQTTAQILARTFNHQVLFYREGLNSIVSVGQDGDARYLKVNGKTDASTLGDMSTQLLLGHLPHLLHPLPERSLVIGFGSGATLAASLVHPVRQVDCVEIEPAVIEAAPLFDEVNHQAYKDPRARIFINDGRNHLLMEKGRYDVIISEPSNPWMAGVSYLFTDEFYRMIDRKMSVGGVFCQWIHAYAISPEDFWMVVATVRSVFPHATLWRTANDDFLIIAQREPFVYPISRIDTRFATLPKLRRDLYPFEIKNAASLLARFQLNEESISKTVTASGINTDDRLPLEFNTPKTLYNSNEDLKEGISKVSRLEPLPAMEAVSGGSPVQDPAFLTELADGYMGYMNLDQAKKYYEAAAGIVPDNAKAMTGLGRILGAEGKDLQAISMFEKAKTADSSGYLGRIYLKQGMDDKALAAFEDAISKDPDQWEFYFGKAQAAEKLGDWSGARTAYETCRSLTGRRLNLDLAIARARRMSGDPENALKLLAELQEAYPMYYPVYQELKATLLALGRPHDAIPYFQELVRKNPYFGPYWIDLISLYMHVGDEKNIELTSQRAQHYPGMDQ